MAAQFFWVFAMILFLEVTFDVSTREVVSFAISDSLNPSGACAVLPKVAFSGVHSGQLVEAGEIPLRIPPDQEGI